MSFKRVLNGRVQNMSAKEEIQKRSKETKRKGKGEEKMGIYAFLFVISPGTIFFICAVVIFRILNDNFI